MRMFMENRSSHKKTVSRDLIARRWRADAVSAAMIAREILSLVEDPLLSKHSTDEDTSFIRAQEERRALLPRLRRLEAVKRRLSRTNR